MLTNILKFGIISPMNKKIDGALPEIDRSFAGRYFRASDKVLVKRALHGLLGHFQNEGEDGLTTWVESEDSEDGHAVILTELSPEKVALKYFVVDRKNRQLTKQQLMELHYPLLETEAESVLRIDQQIRDLAHEFTRDDMLYIIAMLDKVAEQGVSSTQENVDQTVKQVIFEEHLDVLATLYPTPEEKKEVRSPFADKEVISALRQLSWQEQLEESGESVYLQKLFGGEGGERYAAQIDFSADGEPVIVHFLQQSKGQWRGEMFDYTELEDYFEDSALDWETPKILSTIQKGVAISEDAFNLFARDSQLALTDDYSHLDDTTD